jgi:hypothetical protein
MRVVAFVVLSVSLAACSSTPTTGSAPESAAIPPPPPVVIPDAAATEQTVPAKTGAASASPEKGGRIPSGYRLEKRNGKELYCRSITTLGSRFPQKTCFTRAQLEEIQRRTESTMNDMEQGLKTCTGSTACGQGT